MNSKSNLRKNQKNRTPSIFDGCDDLSDQDLERELSSLINSSVSYEKTYKQTQSTNIQGLLNDDLYKDIHLNDPKISDSSDIDDNELLAELNQIMEATEDLDMSFEVNNEGHDTSQPSPPKKLQTEIPFKTKTEQETKPSTLLYSASLLNTLNDRYSCYKDAINVAQMNNDLTKSRRLNRGIKILEKMVKEVKSAQSSNKPLSFTFEEIPPEVTKGKSTRAMHKDIDSLDNLTHKSSDLLIDLSDYNDSNNSIETKTQKTSSPHLKELESEFNTNTVDTSTSLSTFDLDAFMSQLLSQQAEFKEQAIIAKHGNDLENGRKFLIVYKDYQGVIDELLQYKNSTNNSPINETDISFHNLIARAKQLPTLAQYVTLQSPSLNQEIKVAPTKENLQSSSPPHTTKNVQQESQVASRSGTQTAPNFIDELRERMSKYQCALDSAKAEANSSKVRRMTRIMKQYQDAIQAYTSGNKTYPYQELPNPPGFAEIPIAKYLGITVSRGKPDGIEGEESNNDAETRENSKSDDSTKEISPPKSTKADYSHHIKQQLEFLCTRQQVFRREALEAKHKGNLTQAKEYLRLMKGFDPLIQACKSGLPIDMETLPSLPHPSSDEIDHSTNREGENTGTTTRLVGQSLDANHLEAGELRERCDWLEGILSRQIKTCANNARYYVHLGDLSSARNFDNMAAACKRDLTLLGDFAASFLKSSSIVSLAERQKMAPILRYHFETKVLPIVKSNTHLGDNDMELTIVRGYQYGSTANKEMDTYVKYDFPYPSASPQRDKTAVVYGTNNPEYDQTFKLGIDRKSRGLARCFKRQAIKLEVYLKGGLMRFINGDKCLGNVSLKLAPLEQSATLHECCNLMEGRKEAGGRLEVIVKIRDPLLRKEVEEVREKWLVFDP